MDSIIILNITISILFTVFYFHQFIYLAVPFFIKLKRQINLPNKDTPNKYAILIAARNEEGVIENLIKSIKMQNYPKELLKIFVVADNCTDNTAENANKAGATVYERLNENYIGKGYALKFLFENIFKNHTEENFDGFFVFDADNLLDPNYIFEMNKMFNDGQKIITSYRNSKNYADNWISAGYSLWFLRESSFINRSRMLLNTGCAISGTGFLISKEIALKDNGWNFFLLTEDIEFSVYHAIQGNRIAYCHTAIFYDEQPITFKASWYQRLRWARGFYQVLFKYGGKLFTKIFTRPSFWCFDLFMKIAPSRAITAFLLFINIALIIYGLIQGINVSHYINILLLLCLTSYLINFIFGIVTVITEWKKIYCGTFAKLFYAFTFPLFIWTYIPISIVAIFNPVKWKPTLHTLNKEITEFLSK